MRRTSLSAGIAIYDLLTQDEELMRRVTKVFPVVTEEAQLPYVAYARTRMEVAKPKGAAGSDRVEITVRCYAATYGESVEIAEIVRGVLDDAQWSGSGMTMRGCVLTGSSESATDDAFVQELVFGIRI